MNECSSSAVSPSDLSPSNPLRSSLSSGGQVLTLSPPAGDSAGAQDQPAPGASSSSASDLTGDAEGVWSSDIDQAFQEALAIYPPCGRRKIIISDEGKMYGRNELIARYIKIRCGKTRTRKQVSSHIQVLARKKMRDDAAKKKADLPCVSAPAPSAAAASAVAAAAAAVASSLPTPSTVPPAQPPRVPMSVQSFPQLPLPLPAAEEQLKLLQKTALLPATMYGTLWGNPFQLAPAFHPEMKFPPELTQPFTLAQQTAVKCESPMEMQKMPMDMEKLTVSSSQLTLNGFTAYVEDPAGNRVDIVSIPKYVDEIEKLNLSCISDKYPKLLEDLLEKGPSDAFYLAKCWANVHFDATGNDQDLFAVDSYYSSDSHFDIAVSTKVCSFGNEVVEKVEVYSAQEDGGQFSFRLEKSPMCDYMVRFISELKKLDSKNTMNDVLENFTVLQVITNKTTQETLMVLCFIFAVNGDPETTCSLYRLTV